MELYAPPPGFVPSYTVANKPASMPAGQTIFLSNAGTQGSHWYYAGGRYRPVNGQALLSSLDALSSGIGNSETIVFQYLMPAGLWQLTDRLRLIFTMGKSGTTDTGTVRYRIGTAGTISDAQINSGSEQVLGSAANRTAALISDMRLESATTVLQLGPNANGSATSGYSNLANVAQGGVKTISNVSNALYFSVSLLSSSTNDTVDLKEAQLFYLSSAT